MAFTTLPSAGSKLRASVLTSLVTELRPIIAVKTADTSRASTIVRTADPDLVVALPGNSIYDFELMLILTSAADAAGDFSGEVQWTAPTAVVMLGSLGLTEVLATGRTADLVAWGRPRDSASPSANFDHGVSTSGTHLLVSGRIEIGATGGNLLLAWAQLASNINATVLQDGSYLTAYRVG